jgi:thiamine-monophosphate kinase
MHVSAAVPEPLRCPAPARHERLAVSTDTLLCGVHFPADAAAEDVAHKALAANLSDMAAMGARPLALDARVHGPDSHGDWCAKVARHLGAQDTLPTPVTRVSRARTIAAGVTVLVLGVVPADAALRRDGARDGDDLWVSGTLGDAGGGLALTRREADGDDDDARWLRSRLARPTPRVALGQALLGLASAAIDLSDGLTGDLAHISRRSGLGARVQLDALPLSAALLRCFGRERAIAFALAAGDDYELCFTAHPGHRDTISAAARACATPVHRIGRMQHTGRLRFIDHDGREVAPPASYQHAFPSC